MRLRPLLILAALLAASVGAEATTPTWPGADVFDRAQRDGAASVRSELHRKLFQQLRTASRVPSAAGQSQITILNNLSAWCQIWSDAEISQVLEDGAAPDNFDQDVWDPLFRGWTQLRLCTDQLDPQRISGGRVRDLRIAEQSVKALLYVGETELPHKLATLAALADRPDLVEQVRQANGGEIREREWHGDADFQGRSFTSASAFMELDHAARHRRLSLWQKCTLPACIVPPQRETWSQTIDRWSRPLTVFVVLIVGLVVLWNRKTILQSLFP